MSKKPSNVLAEPPEGSETNETSTGQSAPEELSQELLASVSAAESAPTLDLPATAAQEAADASVWVNNKRIGALWSKNENRNSWVSIVGVGWKKLANNSDSAIIAMTMLAAHAKQVNARVDYREESGMIRELYVL